MKKLSEKNMATDYISAILESSTGIALLYHKKRGTVTLPTGKVDAGETPEQACRREMLEELGVKVTHMTLAHTTQHRSPKGNPYIGWHFICNFEGHLVNCEKQKHEIVIEKQMKWADAWDVLASREPA